MSCPGWADRDCEPMGAEEHLRRTSRCRRRGHHLLAELDEAADEAEMTAEEPMAAPRKVWAKQAVPARRVFADPKASRSWQGCSAVMEPSQRSWKLWLMCPEWLFWLDRADFEIVE